MLTMWIPLMCRNCLYTERNSDFMYGQHGLECSLVITPQGQVYLIPKQHWSSVSQPPIISVPHTPVSSNVSLCSPAWYIMTSHCTVHAGDCQPIWHQSQCWVAVLSLLTFSEPPPEGFSWKTVFRHLSSPLSRWAC